MCVRRYLSKHHHIAHSPLPLSDNAVINNYCRGRDDQSPSEEVKFDWQMRIFISSRCSCCSFCDPLDRRAEVVVQGGMGALVRGLRRPSRFQDTPSQHPKGCSSSQTSQEQNSEDIT